MKHIAYLSLGANLGDRARNLQEAERRLGELGTVVGVSGMYETEPVDVTRAQPWYLNAAVALETELEPKELLIRLLELEKSMGRQRVEPKAPRIVDIDIVLFDDKILHTEGLTIPHPRMHLRRFVLEPLAEIAPEVRHPVLKQCVREMLKTLPSGGAVRKAPTKASRS